MLIIICLFLLTCKKYEEGPAFSFRSVKNRMYGLWEIKKLIVDNTIDSLNPDYSKFWIGVDEYDRNSIVFYSPEALTGLWSFEENKTKLNFNFTNPDSLYFVNPIASNAQSLYSIERLTKHEFWLKCNYEGHLYYLKCE